MRKFLVAFLILLSLSGPSWALNCSTAVQGTITTPTQMNLNMADNGPPGNITPGCYRDMVASLALSTGTFVLPTSPVGLVTGNLWVNGSVLTVVP